MSAYSEIGPTLPSRMEVCLVATELQRLAALARELTTPGPKLDLPRAIATLDKARALLADGPGDDA